MRPRVALRSLLFTTVLISSHGVDAQTPASMRPVAAGIGEIRGTVADSVSGRALPGASITVRRADDSSFAGGALPDVDGTFRVAGLITGRYTLRIRALGFGPVIRGGLVISADGQILKVGTIRLSPVATRLEQLDVVAEREEAVIAPDRTSYSTKNMTAAAGGTAIDVLRTIPQVEVDGSQQVSLRGNANVVIQINGRAVPLHGAQLGLFLAQLPANRIKTVEVATTPSAKSDPEGTAGIINIVLDQDAQLGLSGGILAGASSTGQVDVGGNVAEQRGPLTLFVSGDLYGDRRATSGTIVRENLGNPAPAYVDTRLRGTNRPLSGGGTIRSEYRFNGRDALSFDGFLFSGGNAVTNTSSYTDLNAGRSVIGQFDQFNTSALHSASQDYSLAIRHQGLPTTTQFSAEVEYANTDTHDHVHLSGDVIQADATTAASVPREVDNTIAHAPMWNVTADYTKPFGVHTKLEAGLELRRRSSASDFTTSYVEATSGLLIPSVERATAFDYAEDIGAAYAVVSQQVGKIQAQVGLRLEDASTHLDLPDSGLVFDHRYASSYPSAILSYDMTATRQAKLSYSRRVSRPDPQQLSPAEYQYDTRHVSRGNPTLRPEYTDAVEFTLMDAHAWGSILINPYLRRTAHAVRSIQFVDSTGVSVNTFDNVASTRTLGSDVSIMVHHGRWSGSGGGSLYHYSSDASNLPGNLSVHAMVWTLRGNATWKLSSLVDAQLFVTHRAPYATEGGSQIGQTFTTAGVRYKRWGDNGSISLRIGDPFRLQRFGSRTTSGTVIESSNRYFGARAVYLTVSRNFGRAVKLRPKEPEVEQSPPTTP